MNKLLSEDTKIRQPYRSTLDLIANVLYVLRIRNKNLSKAAIMRHAFVSYAQIVEILPLLVEQRLVSKSETSEDKNDELYAISRKGEEFIDSYFNVYKMLCNGDPSDIMPLRFLNIKKI